ncbi:ferrochelatase [Flavihumibacter rivuli]|uniref:ferrochelatase n=1 Tax=Flavihumibacter rivuli TaxID=2838156 RepID=UPI001BDE86FB|nr:ferrochelatase [Flavihumibacter rivuli]ULQ55050.1 ferrochelatase [Flavihumibacter rivuli]
MTKRGIVLMNLGSPDSTAVKDVRRYLDEFLMDERVIDVPYLLRLLLVKGIIVPFRSPKSAKAYASIWTKEGSPLIVLTKQLQEALQQQVSEPVTIAMRYGNPSPQAAYDELMKRVPGLEEVVLVPLYPHYAMSSYETAVEYAKEQHQKFNYPFKLTIIDPYYKEPNYIDALAESIKPYVDKDFDHILFSYHGVPERHIHKGDITGNHCLKVENCCAVDSPAHKQCYRHQCLVTTQLVAEKLGIPNDKFSFSFQSRLGRDEWLKPYTAKRFEEMPGEGIKKLLVACPAFVSDCLETLEEIAEEGKEEFLHAGGESFEMIPCLNVHPLWVKAIVGYVTNA